MRQEAAPGNDRLAGNLLCRQRGDSLCPKGGKMKMINEALRMFLAISALILTAMLSSPASEPVLATKTNIRTTKHRFSVKPVPVAKKVERKSASQEPKGTRIAANKIAGNRFRKF